MLRPSSPHHPTYCIEPGDAGKWQDRVRAWRGETGLGPRANQLPMHGATNQRLAALLTFWMGQDEVPGLHIYQTLWGWAVSAGAVGVGRQASSDASQMEEFTAGVISEFLNYGSKKSFTCFLVGLLYDDAYGKIFSGFAKTR